MPLNRLRAIDVKTKEEELMIQSAIDRIVKDNPNVMMQKKMVINTDFKTKEEELAAQALIDAQFAHLKVDAENKREEIIANEVNETKTQFISKREEELVKEIAKKEKAIKSLGRKSKKIAKS